MLVGVYSPLEKVKVNMVLNVHGNHKAYYGRGEGVEGSIAVSYTHLTLPTMAVV